jgi:death on curing protein
LRQPKFRRSEDAEPKTLSCDEVIRIHEALTANFAAADDPISPPGLRSRELLESAVFRQQTGGSGLLKYNTSILNAAALTFGICLNHSFHNGNKRAALVSLLCHLDRNDLTFAENVKHAELYDFMIKVAAHGFADPDQVGDKSDGEVAGMADWIKARLRKVERGERQITYRELTRILSDHGLEIGEKSGNFANIIRRTQVRAGFFGLRTETRVERIMRIGYPGEGVFVGLGVLREIRDRCGLSDRHGVDSRGFYASKRPLTTHAGRFDTVRLGLELPLA